MLKLLDSNSFFHDDDQQVKILDLDQKASLVKQAADDRISAFAKDIKPRDGYMYLHINAMGAGEYYGSNKNGDYFPEENLKLYHKTFEEHGHVFRHHINKDPAKSIGKVIFSVYNERMHRVELIAEVSKDLGQDIESRIAMGDFPQTSMACKTPYDICSICANRARSRSEYCQHLTTQLNQYLDNGQRVMAINSGPLKFFDISIVIRPADITSSILVKVAGAMVQSFSSIEAAEEEGIEDRDYTVKQAALKKLADLVKTIDEGRVIDNSEELSAIMAKLRDPSKSILETLKKFPLSETLNALAETGTIPSIAFLAEILAHIHDIEEAKGAGRVIEELVYKASPSEFGADSLKLVDGVEEKSANPILVKVIATEYLQSSLNEDAVEKRANAGYSNWNMGHYPEQPQNQDDHIRQIIREELNNSNGLVKTLLTVGGAALVSKFLLSSMIDRKIEKVQQQRPPYVKIGLVKTSSILSDKVIFYKDRKSVV